MNNDQNNQNNGQQGQNGQQNGWQYGNGYQNPNQNGYNPYGNPQNPYGNQYNPYNTYVPPIYQQPQVQDDKGRSAQTMGIIALICALVASCLGAIPGIVLGILAITNANASRAALGYDTSEAKTGRGLGIAALIVSGVMILFSIVYVIILISLI